MQITSRDQSVSEETIAENNPEQVDDSSEMSGTLTTALTTPKEAIRISQSSQVLDFAYDLSSTNDEDELLEKSTSEYQPGSNY